MLQNLPYLLKKKTLIVFFFVSSNSTYLINALDHEFDLKLSTFLPYPKEKFLLYISLFQAKALVPYRKIGLMILENVHFWVLM